jgi:hypothetical protein
MRCALRVSPCRSILLRMDSINVIVKRHEGDRVSPSGCPESGASEISKFIELTLVIVQG